MGRSADAMVRHSLIDVERFRRCGGGDHSRVLEDLGALASCTISKPWKGNPMLRHFVKFQNKVAQLRDERGATAVEYGLMVALIAVVIIVAVAALGGKLSTLFNGVSGSL